MCTEAGMSAIRAERDYVIHEDFMKVILFCFLQHCIAYSSSVEMRLNGILQRECSFFPYSLLSSFDVQAVRKLNEAKKLESSAHYSADFGKE